MPPENLHDLIEGEDFYMEGENLVFTAAYLRKRGYCCESGCRNCPYGFKAQAEAASD